MFYTLNILQLYLNKAGKNHSLPSHVYESVQNYYEIQQFSALSALKVESNTFPYIPSKIKIKNMCSKDTIKRSKRQLRVRGDTHRHTYPSKDSYPKYI